MITGEPIHFSLEDVQDKFDGMLDLVESGERVVLTDGGRPRGMPVPVSQGLSPFRTTPDPVE